MGPNIVSCLASEVHDESNAFYKVLKDLHDHLKGKSRDHEVGAVEAEYLVINNELMPINNIPIVISSSNDIVEPAKTTET